MLLHKRLEQFVQVGHQFTRRMQPIGTVLFDGMDALLFHIAGHNAGECPAQVGSQLMDRLIGAQIQAGHGLVGRLEGLLEFQGNVQPPVKVEGVIIVAAEQGQTVDAHAHCQGHGFRVIDDDLVTLRRLVSKCCANKGIHLAEVVRTAGRAGEHDRQGHVRIVRVQQHAKQVEDFLGGAHPARKDDDAMADPQKRLQPLFDVRHDHQLVDDGVRGLGGDDAGLGDAQIAAALETLFGVGHMGAFHWPLHGTRATAGADILVTQAELIAHALAVVVFLPGNTVAAPADHQVWRGSCLEHAGVAQNVEDRIADALAAIEVETVVILDLIGHIDDIAQHRR